MRDDAPDQHLARVRDGRLIVRLRAEPDDWRSVRTGRVKRATLRIRNLRTSQLRRAFGACLLVVGVVAALGEVAWLCWLGATDNPAATALAPRLIAVVAGPLMIVGWQIVRQRG